MTANGDGAPLLASRRKHRPETEASRILELGFGVEGVRVRFNSAAYSQCLEPLAVAFLAGTFALMSSTLGLVRQGYISCIEFGGYKKP